MNAETAVLHTRLQKTTVAVEVSRAYWSHFKEGVSRAEQARHAFEERWFGARSLLRVRTLLESLRARYDAFPEALGVLRRWDRMDGRTRTLVCHWHLQLSDPLYRKLSGEFLPSRRGDGLGVDRGAVLRWVASQDPGRWGSASRVQLASKLLTASSEAGLVTGKRDPRALLVPPAPDLALGYLLQLLRGTAFEGSLLRNPYLASVGLAGDALEVRLRSLPWLAFRSQGGGTDIEWLQPTLSSWADGVLVPEAA